MAGEIFIMSAGGGKAKHFAAISVTYPAGATVTCSNGTKTFTASDTTGKWMFSVPSAGTWTVTATDGSKTKSVDVVISTEGQHEEITLSFVLVIFDAGSYAAETGGFSPDNAIADGQLSCVAGSSTYTAATRTVYSINLIDLTAYSTLYFTVTASAAGYQAQGDRKLGISTAADSSNSFYATASNGVGTQAIDLSSVEGSYAIKMFVSCWTNSNNWTDNTLKVSKIWAE